MGSGETSAPGMTSTHATTGVINAPADYDDTAGVTSGSFTWQVLFPDSSLASTGTTGSFTSANPAIWETEPKNNIDLDIYYEIGQIYATRLNERTCKLHAPIGSEVKIYRPADTPYALLVPGTPVGWIPWLNNEPMFVGSWNQALGQGAPPIIPYDPTFPNAVSYTHLTLPTILRV